MTKLDKRRGQIRVIGSILVLILVIVSIKFFIQNSNRKVTANTPIAHAEAVESTIAPEVVPEPIPEQTPAVEPVEAPQSIIPEQRPILDNDAKAFIYQRESNNCPTRWQGEYGPCPAYHGSPDPKVAGSENIGYGLCQATPAWKMAVMGPGWETSWELQDQWCTQYANNRYGGWQNAYYWWSQNRWW